jgi:hypothetical protein
MATAKKIGQRKPKQSVWQAFASDTELLKKNQVNAEELEILGDFSPLGVLTGSGDLLFILETIRWARDKKPSA